MAAISHGFTGRRLEGYGDGVSFKASPLNFRHMRYRVAPEPYTAGGSFRQGARLVVPYS